MKLSEFDYSLPPEAIAQQPASRRDSARLLVHSRASGSVEVDRTVADLPSLLSPGDLMVFNDTRVIPVRLLARRATGGKVEVLLADPVPDEPAHWDALVNPARKMNPGEIVQLDGFGVRMIERLPGPDGLPGPRWRVALLAEDGAALANEATVTACLERVGHMPLPPYIQRNPGDSNTTTDRDRYQTVYAARPGAIAAPTAGLHFTPELLQSLSAAGIEQTRVTLHVGLGTFQPVQVDDLDNHTMHAERFEMTEESARAINACRARGSRIVAVGTTSVRVLESCSDPSGTTSAARGETRLFIQPGYTFRSVDALITNFHLPRSTLLVLVSALAGRDQTLNLYQTALNSGYRFYSYGDAMLIL